MADPGASAPTNTAGHAPLRRPSSIRRTSSIDTDWPEGIGKPMRMRGRARDLFTAATGEGRVLADDWTEFTASALREILTISSIRSSDAVQALVGKRAGGKLRSMIPQLAPGEHARTTPLHLLLDDFSGASLVAGWAWSRWYADWMTRSRQEAFDGSDGQVPMVRNMEGTCAGFAPGASSMLEDGSPAVQSATPVPPLNHPDDPLSWHPLDAQGRVGMRRARRTDVWLADGEVKIDIGFQDSSTSPNGPPERIAVHEYRVTATADPKSLHLLSIDVDPRVLPYRECPGASPKAKSMEGVELASFRLQALERLTGVNSCTHLNDVLRSMADVPNLVRALREALAG